MIRHNPPTSKLLLEFLKMDPEIGSVELSKKVCSRQGRKLSIISGSEVKRAKIKLGIYKGEAGKRAPSFYRILYRTEYKDQDLAVFRGFIEKNFKSCEVVITHAINSPKEKTLEVREFKR